MKISDKALEMIIHDVLGGMEELAIMEGFEATTDYMEILSIETPDDHPVDAPREPADAPPQNAVVLPFPDLKKTA